MNRLEYAQRPVPAWVSDGAWHANDPHGHRWAVERFKLTIHTTEAERAEATAFVLPASHPCASCGRFAFPVAGTICYWCRE